MFSTLLIYGKKLYHRQVKLKQTILLKKVSRLRLCEMKVLKYYVENKALFETWT